MRGWGGAGLPGETKSRANAKKGSGRDLEKGSEAEGLEENGFILVSAGSLRCGTTMAWPQAVLVSSWAPAPCPVRAGEGRSVCKSSLQQRPVKNEPR